MRVDMQDYRRLTGRLYEAAAKPPEVKVRAFARLTDGASKLELFHVERAGQDYVLRHESGSSLSFGIVASGSAAEMEHSFDLEVDNAEKGTRLYHLPNTLETRKLDAAARKHLLIFSHPVFGVSWDKEVPGAVDASKQFLGMLKRQLKDWKGSSNGMPVQKHREWEAFHRDHVVPAVKKKYGSRVTIYRGLRGAQAKAAIAGEPIPFHRYSSWTSSMRGARAYKGPKGTDWAVIRITARPGDIQMAPVDLPGFVEPGVLHPLATDVEHVGDELILNLPQKSLRTYKVVAKTRRASR